MFGKIELANTPFGLLRDGLLMGAVCVAGCTDVLRGKIYNWLTFPLFFSGLLFSLTLPEGAGVASVALGVFLAALVFFPMHLAGMLGAGDVKLLLAVASWLPWKQTLHLLLLSVLVGGVIAAVLLALKGKLGVLLVKLRRSATSLLIRELSFELPKIDRAHTFPFGVAIAIATIWVLLADPVQRVGVFPWD